MLAKISRICTLVVQRKPKFNKIKEQGAKSFLLLASCFLHYSVVQIQSHARAWKPARHCSNRPAAIASRICAIRPR